MEINALLKPITGKLVINTTPVNAEIWIDGQLRGRAPTTINDIDMATAKMLEIRWAGYDGSRGKYAAPLFQTAHSAINASRDLSTHTPTIRSAVTP